MIKEEVTFGQFKLTNTPPTCAHNNYIEQCTFIGVDRCLGVELFPEQKYKVELK